jgi:hypothetical protein
MVSEFGLNEPPPPAIDMLALPVGMQLGWGLGLGDELGPGEGLGLADGFGLGEGLGLADGFGLGEGLGLGPCASAVAPAIRKNTLTMASRYCIQKGRLTSRVSEER